MEDLSGLATRLRAAASAPHGQRRNHMQADARADITLNGTRRRASRIEVDWNGTTRPGLLEAAGLHGFLVEPAMEGGLDEEVDGLRRSERACWVHRGVREGRKGVWAVFDLARRHEPFSAEIKQSLRGRFACLENDDWNWYVELDGRTLAPVARLVRNHGFAFSAELRAMFAAAAARARSAPPAS